MAECINNKIREKLCQLLKENCGNDLLQIVLYNDKDPHTDDILVICQSNDLQSIKATQSSINFLKKNKIAVPFFMSPEFISSSLDSYPLEFLNIQNDYITLYALNDKDYIQSLTFDKKWVRLQIERELKSKYLLITSNYMAFNPSDSRLKDLITQSVLSLKPVLKGLLFLKNAEIPSLHEALIEALQKNYQMQLSNIKTAFLIAHEQIKIKSINTETFFMDYLKEIQALCTHIEEIE